MAHGHAPRETPQLGRFVTSSSAKSLFIAMMLAGAATFAAGLVLKNDRVWTAYLIAFFYFVSLSLGGLFFTAIQHVTNAGWSSGIRRLAESFTAFLPVGAIGAAILLLGGRKLFIWLDPSIVANDELLQAKAAYLNFTFWAIRLVVFFGLWIFFTKKIVGNSVKQDESGDESLTKRNIPLSIAFLLTFALSYSFFSVDSMMSLQPHWFSTIFGIYCFAGLFQSTLAFLSILMVYMMKRGLMKGYLTDHHLHDVGKFLFAFTVFWAYIAFSQFMLMWYANLPEETEFYWNRMYGGWLAVTIGLSVFRFVVPFFALLPRWAKRKHSHLVAVSVLVLIMQYVDLYWIVYPNFNENAVVFSVWEVLIFVGFLGAFLFAVTRFLSSHNLVAIKDPRLHETLSHEVTY